MPLTYESSLDEIDLGWLGVVDGAVGGLFAGESVTAGAFEDAWVGSPAAGWVEQFADLGDGFAEMPAQAVRGKRPPGR